MNVFLGDREGSVFKILELVQIDLSLLAHQISKEIELLPEQVGGVDSLKPSANFNQIFADSKDREKKRRSCEYNGNATYPRS